MCARFGAGGLKQGLQHRPDIGKDLGLGLGGGMQAIGLHEATILGDAGEEIRDQGHPFGLGDLLEQSLKDVVVGRTVVGRQADGA